jgi:hypothetical protein
MISMAILGQRSQQFSAEAAQLPSSQEVALEVEAIKADVKERS